MTNDTWTLSNLTRKAKRDAADAAKRAKEKYCADLRAKCEPIRDSLKKDLESYAECLMDTARAGLSEENCPLSEETSALIKNIPDFASVLPFCLFTDNLGAITIKEAHINVITGRISVLVSWVR
jgi:hypothetical protein